MSKILQHSFAKLNTQTHTQACNSYRFSHTHIHASVKQTIKFTYANTQAQAHR